MWQLGKSKKAFDEAKHYLPGGVNSPVRSYRNVGSQPPFISSAAGSRIYDVDNNEYIDYVLSWGPMILGHANPEVIAATRRLCHVGPPSGRQLLWKRNLLRRFKLSCLIWK